MFSFLNSTSRGKAISTIGLIFGSLVCLKTCIVLLLASEVNYSFNIRTFSLAVSNLSATRSTENSDRNAAGEHFITSNAPDKASDKTTVDAVNVYDTHTITSKTISQYDKDSYFIVFVIPTHPKKIAIRQAIRETWANVTAWSLLANEDEDKKKIKVMFVVGVLESGSYSAAFQDELSRNSDVFVATNITEGYYSLRYKELWGITHSYQNYKFQYLVKTDDDVIVNLPILIQVLSGFAPGLHYAGSCVNRVGSKPQRWRYCSGGGYVFSRELVKQILNLPDSVHQRSMKPEDVFSGWLVWNVNNLNNVYNTTEYTVRPRNYYRALSMGQYRCGLLNKWFYHGYRSKNYQYRVETFRNSFMNNSVITCGT